ncbi:hypothetical protein HOT31_gp122 [Microbacterium phage Hendrix]|uniref:Uncharacterized protein n=1 Tax=Microbacterium phage Hendrix TaxID=2182341 RepID=A0A2U8UUQ2_9CAUD|nr:hypothetical protein HOT31_gp122 [Microbacterium phage Hendrix]AWN07792.1 hypothetical protein PBI_HENDRIX_121 [Microbacterium phage Hendrix]
MNVEINDIVLLGLFILVGSVALIVGAALGAYSAFRQTKDDEAKAWDKGYRAGTRDSVSALTGLNSESTKTPNPHRLRGPFPRRTKAEDAPHV